MVSERWVPVRRLCRVGAGPQVPKCVALCCIWGFFVGFQRCLQDDCQVSENTVMASLWYRKGILNNSSFDKLRTNGLGLGRTLQSSGRSPWVPRVVMFPRLAVGQAYVVVSDFLGVRQGEGKAPKFMAPPLFPCHSLPFPAISRFPGCLLTGLPLGIQVCRSLVDLRLFSSAVFDGRDVS